jgi:anti-sigma factor RsiW
MKEKHYQEKLSTYLNHELPKDERQAIAEHLLQCEKCRKEHDQIKFGVALASSLKSADAPPNLWSEIENSLDKKKAPQIALIPQSSFFNMRGLTAALAALLIVSGLAMFVYFGLFKPDLRETAESKPETIKNGADLPVTIQNQNEVLTPNSDISNVQTNASTPDQAETANAPFWQVEAIAGAPTAGDQTISKQGKLAVGEFLETDAKSRARVQVANIGQVEIAPNSRVRLVNTHSAEHRLSLERGVLQATIFAPPRLFIVDTPSAVAVDLGCAYTLEVDREGNSRLHVTSGYVALERDGGESIVPAGAIALTKKGKGLGTPFAENSSAELQKALYKFDFANGGSAALQTIIKESDVYDSLTLWHLLSRTPRKEREKAFDALASHVKPPASVTRQGIMRLDKKMLEDWWTEIENVWFG